MSRSTKARKSTETTNGDSKHADEPSNCIICLEKVVCRGKLSVCNHWFCFPCILEWSENTNTCPICKARFRCITKVHLSPFRSPPTKVRIGDKDQRVWNDDDELVAEDVVDAIDSDDFDDDYEPPTHVENPWTRSSRHQNARGGNSRTSRQLGFDDYDLEDSFIDDTDQALQAYLHETYNRGSLETINNGGDESDSGESIGDSILIERTSSYQFRNRHVPRTRSSGITSTGNSINRGSSETINNGGDESDSGESSGDSILIERTSPYQFRNRHAPRTRSSGNTSTCNTINSVTTAVSLPHIEEESCASPASTGSFIVSDNDDDSPDELNSDWVPFGNNGKNSRNKGKLEKEKAKKHSSKKTKSSVMSRPKRPKKQKECKQRCSNSKRKRQQTSVSEDEGTSSRHGETSQSSIDGWISMASKRARAHPSSSSTTNQRTPRKRACKGKKAVKIEESANYSELYDSSSDSEIEVLNDRIKKGRLKATGDNKPKKEHQSAVHDNSVSRTKEVKNKQTKNSLSRLKPQQQCIPSASTLTSTVPCDDICNNTYVDDNDFSNVTFIQPTPQPDKKRSIFTRRQHRSPSASFDHLEDITNTPPLSQAQTRQRKRDLTDYQDKASSTRGRTESNLGYKGDIQHKMSPVIKKTKQRKRVMSLSSDSD